MQLPPLLWNMLYLRLPLLCTAEDISQNQFILSALGGSLKDPIVLNISVCVCVHTSTATSTDLLRFHHKPQWRAALEVLLTIHKS